MSFRSLPRASFTVSRNYTYSFIYSPPQGKNVWLLFLHGFPSTAYDWRHQIPFFINLGYGVVAPDLLGYGQSPKPAELEAYKAKAMSADIIEILKSKNITKVIGVAHDLWVISTKKAFKLADGNWSLGVCSCCLAWKIIIRSISWAMYSSQRHIKCLLLISISLVSTHLLSPPLASQYSGTGLFSIRRTREIFCPKRSVILFYKSIYNSHIICQDASFQSLFYPENPEIWYSDLCTRDGARLWIQQGKVTPPAKYITAEVSRGNPTKSF